MYKYQVKLYLLFLSIFDTDVLEYVYSVAFIVIFVVKNSNIAFTSVLSLFSQ